MAGSTQTRIGPSETTARLLWPRRSLAGCIFAAIVRDTRGVELNEIQRFNHFPATPLCTLHWLLEGQGHLITRPEHALAPITGPLFPRFAFFGPQSGPWHAWSPGQVHLLTLVVWPEAFTAMTGVDMTAQVGRMAPAEEVLPEAMLAGISELLQSNHAEDCTMLFHALEERFDVWWRMARSDRHAAAIWLKDWRMSLAARAATAGVGRGVRQIQRRMKSWTGQTDRELQALEGTESLFARFGSRWTRENINWAQVAVDCGFADQSHMTRRVRRDTGFTPEQLRKLIEHDEAFWCYRLLGEQYWSLAAAAETATEEH